MSDETPAGAGQNGRTSGEPGRGITAADGTPLTGTGLVLVVDDEASVRHYTKRLLERAGFQVQTTCKGAEGVEFLKNHPEEVTLAVVDMSMCNMDGLETMRRMRECRPGIPVVIMSGYNHSSVLERPGGNDATNYVQKPFKAAEFLSVVCEAAKPAVEGRPPTP